MANTVTNTVLTDSAGGGTSRHYISYVDTSEETDTVLLDASALVGANSISHIKSVSASLVGFSATLEFDATADVPFLVLPEGESHFDFSKSPIPNNAGSGSTGDVTVTTVGLGAAGDSGTIFICYKKDSSS